MNRSTQLLLPGMDWDSPPRRERPTKARRGPLCRACKAKVPRKPRSVMPLSHAVETVRGVFMDRLDELCADWLANEGKRYRLTRDAWIDLFGSLALKLFPEEMGPGPAYTPDPAGRMDTPPNPVGLVPRLPTMAIYAKYLEQGKQSPVANMTTTVKDREGNDVTVPLFTDADLCRLGERMERRDGRAV